MVGLVRSWVNIAIFFEVGEFRSSATIQQVFAKMGRDSTWLKVADFGRHGPPASVRIYLTCSDDPQQEQKRLISVDTLESRRNRFTLKIGLIHFEKAREHGEKSKLTFSSGHY